MAQQLLGVNAEKMNRLIVNVYDDANKINSALTDIADLVDETNSFYKSEEADNFRRKFNKYKVNFEVITENIKSYNTDFKKVLSAYSNNDAEVSSDVRKSAVDISSSTNYNNTI